MNLKYLYLLLFFSCSTKVVTNKYCGQQLCIETILKSTDPLELMVKIYPLDQTVKKLPFLDENLQNIFLFHLDEYLHIDLNHNTYKPNFVHVESNGSATYGHTLFIGFDTTFDTNVLSKSSLIFKDTFFFNESLKIPLYANQ